MFRHLALPSASISPLIWLSIAWLISACNTRPDDVLPASYTLVKGTTLNAAALISQGMKEFTGISTNTSQDKALSDLKTARPTQIKNYLNTQIYPQSIIAQVRNLDVPQYTFSWNPTNKKVIMLALFKQVIQVADNQISNPQDIVWLWTPPIGTTDPGKVSFSSGKMALYENGKFDLVDVPKTNALPLGMYVWAVWVWDDKAINIMASSRELPIYIIP
jgi:hypothetical protein